MATREEILSKYEDDKEDKNVQLQTVLSSRIGQLAKENSAGINNTNVKIIGQIFTPIFSFHRSTPLIRSTIRRSNLAVKSELEKEFQRLAISDFENTDGEPDAYILVECRLYQQSSVKFQVTVEESVYLRLPGERIFSKISGVLSFGRSESIVLSSESNGFEELKLKLSGISYPIESLVSNRRFEIYNQEVNINLENKKLPPIGPMPILVYSIFQLQDFSTIFPKPDGLDTPPSVPETPSVPTPPSVPETPSVPTPPSVPETPSVPDVPSTPTPPTNAKKYLSIESIKDDDPVIETQTTSSQVISLRFIDDDQDDQYYSRNELTPIKTETVSNKQGDLPNKPLGDKNPIVVSNEKQEKDKRTEAQRLAEEADSLTKETPKEKSSTGASGPNPNLKDGKTAKQEENLDPIPEDKKPEEIKSPNKSSVKTFGEWVVVNKVDSGGIIYRGVKDRPYTKPGISKLINGQLVPHKKEGTPPRIVLDPSKSPISPPSVDYGKVHMYKSLFNFGNDLKSIFSGFKIESPIDVALLMNTEIVGQFNKKWPYLFGEGSEIHLAMTRAASVEFESKGGFGTFNLIDDTNSADANWASNPHWCGLCTNFMLFSNGIYKSDDEPKNIVATGAVEGYYNKSPFNSDPRPGKQSISSIESKYTKDINLKKKTISSNEAIIKTKEDQLKIEQKKAEKKEQNYINNTDTTEISQEKIKSFYVMVESIKALIDSKKNINANLQLEIEELELKKENEIKNLNISSGIDENGTVALFYRGVHWNSNTLTSAGIELWEKIKLWPGGYIVRRKAGETSGHVETLLCFTKTGLLYTIGGNTGLNDASGNGSQYGFKLYDSISSFCKNGEFEQFYVVKRGVKTPYTNGIGVSVKKTELYNKYVSDLQKKDETLSSIAYNTVLRHIMEV